VSGLIRFGAGCVDSVGEVAEELGLERLVLVTSKRGAALAERLPVVGAYAGVRSHAPVPTIEEAARLALDAGADGLVGLGGGSAVDSCKAVALRVLEQGRTVRTIAVPTTYAGAEWTPFFGMRDEDAGRKLGGSDDRVTPAAAVYDPELTLDLSREDSAGTAMNALAHCAEAFYGPSRSEHGDRHAHCGARTISYALPLVLADGGSVYARSRLLEGAMRAALALGEAGLALGHAMAQALGGRYGLPHGALNAVCLPPALRFNEPAVPDAIARFGEALGTGDPIGRVEELARLGGFERLRDLGVPEEDLAEVAEATAARAGARANPRPASPDEIAELLRSVW
jgi:maleylacetate reductase